MRKINKGEVRQDSRKHRKHPNILNGPGKRSNNPLLLIRHKIANLHLERPKHYWPLLVNVFLWPLRPLEAMADSHRWVSDGDMRVPTYYAADSVPSDDYQTFEHARHRNFCGPAFITLIFGSIHCVGWNLEFPTYREWLLWQISSFTMVGVSLVFILYAVHEAIQSSNKNYPQNISKYGELTDRTLHQLCIIATIFYIPARCYILFEALYSLRALPDGAYQTVNWTRFIPNFQLAT